MGEYYWDTQIEYLKKTRTVWFNDDYLELLIRSVWRITAPVCIADFGCGGGFLGGALMPLMPAVSTYTGYDKGAKLIECAKALYADAPFKMAFHQCDLLEQEFPEKYDIVICQALLMHIPQPERMLSRMIDAASPGGLIICIEPNWNVSNAILHIDGLDVEGQCNLGLLSKLWKHELETQGTDKCIGTKTPFMMHKLGLVDVGIRMNDCIRFANPHASGEDYQRQRAAFLSDGWGHEMEDEGDFVDRLQQRGVIAEEARLQYRCERDLNEYVARNEDSIFALSAPPTFISFGRKPVDFLDASRA